MLQVGIRPDANIMSRESSHHHHHHHHSQHRSDSPSRPSAPYTAPSIPAAPSTTYANVQFTAANNVTTADPAIYTPTSSSSASRSSEPVPTSAPPDVGTISASPNANVQQRPADSAPPSTTNATATTTTSHVASPTAGSTTTRTAVSHLSYANPATSSRSTSSLPSQTSGPSYRPITPEASSSGSSPQSQPIKVRDLAHVVELAQQEARDTAQDRSANRLEVARRRYEISSMPVSDVIEMVAGLLTKITTTNDRQQAHIGRQSQDSGNYSALASSILAFHGRNVPAITIQNYLGRIHRYCPTTYEVFLSLLVYFDRMTERVNKHVALQSNPSSRPGTANGGATPISYSNPTSPMEGPLQFIPPEVKQPRFVVDSFNIHRLVIAGVTCASKFFSDVFFTNSRYAKVGGLPLKELNDLELQFLILNDFRLSVPVEELETYGTMLVQFYGREALVANMAAAPPPPALQAPSQQAPVESAEASATA